MAEILFHGAAHEVTGSMHMVHAPGGWVALDCGLFQGHRQDSDQKNRQWPMPPREISAVVLSHAHTDHTGRLPSLLRDGFKGKVYATPATRDLCGVMLPDSAHIQVEDAQYANKKRARRGLPPIEPLYGPKDAVDAVKLIRSTPCNDWFEVVPGLRACYREAGHMLGSAGIELAIANGGSSEKRMFFSGDVGRRDTPIINDPVDFPLCELVICESTYGGRVNESVGDAREHITGIMQRTYARGGKVIIPAFSIGRTQTVVYFLAQLIEAGQIPAHPIFVDSPLSLSATSVYQMHPECYDLDARTFNAKSGSVFGNGHCTYIHSVEESIRLNTFVGSCTIISASGMCETGRILHHLKNNIEKPKNTVLIPGFQAEGTLGRRLVDGVKEVNIFHENHTVRAEVVQIHGFSGHADQADLLRMLTPLKDVAKRVFLVHGEPDQSMVLAGLLKQRGFASVELAERGQRVEI